MAISKRTYQDLTEADFHQYRENQWHDYQDELVHHEETINEWQATIQQQEDIFCELADKAEEGNEIEVFTTLRMIKKVLDETLKQIEPMAMQSCELEAPDNKPFIRNGFEIQKRTGGRIIDYTSVPVIAEKIEELDRYKNKVKHALQGLEKGATMLSDGQMILADGECVDVPKYKFKKDSIVVKKL